MATISFVKALRYLVTVCLFHSKDYKIESARQKSKYQVSIKMQNGKRYQGHILDVQDQVKIKIIDDIFMGYHISRIEMNIINEPRIFNRYTAFSRLLSRLTNFDADLYELFRSWRVVWSKNQSRPSKRNNLRYPLRSLNIKTRLRKQIKREVQ